MTTIHTDICVIGAGSGGLSVAAGASQMGADVVLIEKGKMGGDCLNTGCVPSKAILAAGHVAQTMRDASAFGIKAVEPNVDWGNVHKHIHDVIATITPNDSVERFEGLGVNVIQAAAEFVDKNTVKAGDKTIKAKYFVVATGSSAFVPPIDGVHDVPFYTNENIFDKKEAVEHLIIVGGCPIGMELAQAHRRLGAKVTVIEVMKLLSKDDPDLTSIVIEHLRKEGIHFHEGVNNLRFEQHDDGIHAFFDEADGDNTKVCDIHGSHLLIATGRKANVDGLNLEAANVSYSPRGIEVDARLRSSNKRVFAIGDVAGPYQFTHMAAYQAGIIIRNILFKLPAKVDYSAVPWVTYTDPELAHVGLTEADAKAQGKDVRILKWDFSENDRAQAEQRTEGLVKVVVTPKGLILGASIVGLHAGELIQPWILAISQNMKIGAMASAIAPYPTLAEVNKRIAGSLNKILRIMIPA
jgi:pyruvate/2-oxoglutarate dehydrogenase complex dihydrolipoamide dehydrogenase (E3) component